MSKTMQAVGIDRYGGPEVVALGTWPRPEPGPGEVQVRVEAAGVNPLDWKVRDGSVREHLSSSPPFIIGADVAGTVEAVGSGVTRHKVGDAVFGQVGLLGGYAEYAVTAQHRLARKPSRLSPVEAASLPISAMTAWQGLFREGKLEEGQTVLIHGGAGGVGSFAIQFAHDIGAHVITTTSAGNAAFVRELGADEVIDYRSTRFEDHVHDLDLVLDTMFYETLERSWRVLRPGGMMVSTVGTPDPAKAKAFGVGASWVIGKPDDAGHDLDHIADLIEQGRVRTNVQQVFPFAAAGEALETSKAGHVRGKLVIRVRE